MRKYLFSTSILYAITEVVENIHRAILVAQSDKLEMNEEVYSSTL